MLRRELGIIVGVLTSFLATQLPFAAPAPTALSPTIPPLPAAGCPILPTAPEGQTATASLTFTRPNNRTRSATIWYNPSVAQQRKNGQIVLYWHGTYGSPAWAKWYGLFGSFGEILNNGGIVIAPKSEIGPEEFEWHILRNRTNMEDMEFADDIVACFMATGYFDPTHIHSAGFSAGAQQTIQLSLNRPSYIASIASFSGGLREGFTPPPPPRPISSMIAYGGKLDVFYRPGSNLTRFEPQALAFYNYTRATGAGAVLCNHGMSHTVPPMGLKPVLERFFEGNKFGVVGEEYGPGKELDRQLWPSYCRT